tara:strand:+ start:341 stop:685 length:345 start_codon:yes stop_codon:yes gene_type:complete
MPFSTDLSTSPLPDSRITFRRHHANEPSKTTPLGRTSPDQAKEQMDAARRRARQSIREYELICGCCSSACVQCLGLLASLALALHAATTRPRHGSCQTLKVLGTEKAFLGAESL